MFSGIYVWLTFSIHFRDFNKNSCSGGQKSSNIRGSTFSSTNIMHKHFREAWSETFAIFTMLYMRG